VKCSAIKGVSDLSSYLCLTFDKLCLMARRSRDEWLSVVEAARALGISREAIYAAVKEGRLKAGKKMVTRHVWRIDPESVASFQVSKSHQNRARRQKRDKPKRTKAHLVR
jgi:excisionase family DNA binding protein